MERKLRFACPTAGLDLRSVVSRPRLPYCAALLVSLALHLASALWTSGLGAQTRPAKPLEMRKRPQPRHRRIRRQMVSVKARLYCQTGRPRGCRQAPLLSLLVSL